MYNRRSSLPLALCGLYALLGGCEWGTLSEKEFDRLYPYGRGHFFFQRGVAEAEEAFSARLGPGPVRALSLSFYNTYVILQAQDPKQKDHVDRYTLRADGLEEPEPVRIEEAGRALEEKLFSLDEVALDKIPALFKEVDAHARQREGRVTHILVERGRGGVAIEIYWSSDRYPGGSFAFSAQGLPLGERP
jgi:hypothetical protein